MLRLLSTIILIGSLVFSFCSEDPSDEFVGLYEASYISRSFRNAVGITSSMEGDTIFEVRDGGVNMLTVLGIAATLEENNCSYGGFQTICFDQDSILVVIREGGLGSNTTWIFKGAQL